jgi:uncharacterized protein
MTSTDLHTGPATARLAPVAPKDRIFNLDMLRGWAILGILAVNAIAFAWPSLLMMAEAPPPANTTQADVIGVWVIDVFFSDKMRTLFTLLFGVSIFLVGGERSDLDRGALLRRRLWWLMLIGAIHGAALWFGDILFLYAVSGFLFLMFRSWSARRLLWVGGLITLFWALVATGFYWGMANLPADIASKMTQGMPVATPEAVQAVVDTYRSGWPAGWLANLTTWATFLVAILIMVPVTVPLMMIGLGLYKSGYLTGTASMGTYLTVLVLGGANLAVSAYWGWQKAMAPDGVDHTGGLAAASTGAAPLVTLFYVTALILLTKFGLKVITQVLVPVGRMAFTNYLSQTLIMVTLYYAPWGPMWFGTHSTSQMWMVVGAVWLAQLIWSPLWLSVFRMGPLEWAWRCLTYGRMVRISKGGD